MSDDPGPPDPGDTVRSVTTDRTRPRDATSQMATHWSLDQAPQGPVAGSPSLPAYALRRLLGTGGMGEVWEAAQGSLDRRAEAAPLVAELTRRGPLSPELSRASSSQAGP